MMAHKSIRCILYQANTGLLSTHLYLKTSPSLRHFYQELQRRLVGVPGLEVVGVLLPLFGTSPAALNIGSAFGNC